MERHGGCCLPSIPLESSCQSTCIKILKANPYHNIFSNYAIYSILIFIVGNEDPRECCPNAPFGEVTTCRLRDLNKTPSKTMPTVCLNRSNSGAQEAVVRRGFCPKTSASVNAASSCVPLLSLAGCTSGSCSSCPLNT